MIRFKKSLSLTLCAVLLIGSLGGCTNKKSSSADGENTDNNSSAVSSGASAQNVERVKVEYSESDLDAAWSENGSTIIKLNGNTADISGSGAAVSGKTVTISSAGTYVLSGTLIDGQIKIACSKNDKVRVIFNGINITNSDGEPFVVEEADKVRITLADNTDNNLSDKSRAVSDTEEYSAVISSKADLVINGNGTLNIHANYRNGIKSSDDLLIVSGSYNIVSNEDGIIGKDILGIRNGIFNIEAGVDGLKSTNDTNEDKGDIVIDGGTFTITAKNDGIQSESDLCVYGGEFDIKTGEGASAAVNSSRNSLADRNFGMGGDKHFGGDWNETSTTNTESIKGMKATDNIVIDGGTFKLSCEDDAIHSNATIVLSGGTYNINSGDDGIHADMILQIDKAGIDIQSSYEGLEAASIILNGGEINIAASDDGINASAGNDSSTPMRGGMGVSPQQGQPGQQGQVQQQQQSSTNTPSIVINGGDIYVNAGGDGIDSNGTVTMTGGKVVVSGPTDNGNSSLDFETGFDISGGTLMAFGSSGMLEKPTSATNGCCIVAAFDTQAANTGIYITDSTGVKLMEYNNIEKSYSSAVLYSSDIKSNQAYTVYAGEAAISVTANEGVTVVGNAGGSGFGGNRAGGMKGDGFDDNRTGGMKGDGSDGSRTDGMKGDGFDDSRTGGMKGDSSDGNSVQRPDGADNQSNVGDNNKL